MTSHFLLFQLALLGYLVSFVLLIVHFLFFPGKTNLVTRLLLTAAVALHLISLVLRGLAAQHTPVANFFESLNLFIFFIALVACWQLWRSKSSSFSGIFPLLIIAVTAIFIQRVSPRITQMYPALQSIWFEVHVISAFLSYALFTMGAGLSVFYFFRRNSKIKFLTDRVPPHVSLDRFTYKHNAWGFFWFSFSMLTGGIWAYYAWGNYWIWTAKEIWSATLWLYYAVYIHAGFTPRWAGKRANALSIIGFGVMIFTFLGVNLMLRSSHSF